jgi:hypothetical protein
MTESGSMDFIAISDAASCPNPGVVAFAGVGGFCLL